MCAILPAFQEGVAVEIAEAVVGALRGELSATAVNAPMVPPEVKTPYLLILAYSISLHILINDGYNSNFGSRFCLSWLLMLPWLRNLVD